ncbi:MAG TPA: general stress protein [Amycolatopsis sp.]|uniref:general stress protein n=1 Tax=Amycolatopsis sp. TaxID=37632 RepID=UPI002B47AB6D|nr:general stress protein [Amycolatopsis sp.]HKS48522.1 general stress protein [Amycolatopsis sp.]
MTDPHFAPAPLKAAEPQHRLASFDTYLDAQRLVDRMSDDGFPVEHVRIVGDGIRTVEQVTGRMTRGKAAAMGAVCNTVSTLRRNGFSCRHDRMPAGRAGGADARAELPCRPGERPLALVTSFPGRAFADPIPSYQEVGLREEIESCGHWTS